MDMSTVLSKWQYNFCQFKYSGFFSFFFLNFSHLQSRDPAVQAAILAQLNAKYGSGVLPDAPKDMSKASFHFCLCDVSPFCFCLCYIPATAAGLLLWLIVYVHASVLEIGILENIIIEKKRLFVFLRKGN